MQMLESSNVATFTSNLYLFLKGSLICCKLAPVILLGEGTVDIDIMIFFLFDKIVHTTDIELQNYFLNVQQIKVH